MVSSTFLAGALAIFAISGVNAGPCRPSSVSTTETLTAIESTATESSLATSEETTLTLSTTAELSVTTTQTTAISDVVSSSETLVDATTTTQATALETTTATGLAVTTTEATTVSEDISSSVTLSDDTTTLLMITTTTQAFVDTATTAAATTTTTAAAEQGECTLNSECEALNGGANPICDAGTCVPDDSQGDPCSDESDFTTPGQSCSAEESCSDANECLLSTNRICTLGLCECPEPTRQCTPRSDLQLCQSTGECSAGATCQQGICVDQVACTGESSCLANLDLCVLPGACVCRNGVCALGG
ncbi:uncharacterized protein BKA55DRAFT_597355 [Fusarium redolens]|uniref:Uncharacterized protein n=1 Tax=Fusarium redolens TaxID=48865 RepID=A0A9P9GF59_FUSRE|nr:uncharacterized protein BKA55DRAFT_597355 [Fusarium redolens]KAH7236827.1 hypothetical protein BKA55DRAFT_597355 [Fusarium redolens]